MKKKPENIFYNVSFNEKFEAIKNSGFLKGRARIAYAGENRNWSNISKQSFDNALDSLSLIPIVGNWLPEKNNYGGHDISIEESGNSLKVVDKTRPYGVVPENHNAEWVDVEDENGNIKKYVECDVILWKERYEEPIQKIIDGGVNQSMEIIPTEADYNEDTGYFDIKSFYYSALCLLGRDEENSSNNIEPCFEDSEVTAYQFNLEKNEFKSEFNLMMKELKELVKGGENVDIENKKEFETEEGTAEIEETPIGEEEVSTEISLPETDEESIETDEEVEGVAETETEEVDTEKNIEEEAEANTEQEIDSDDFAELKLENDNLKIELNSLKAELKELREFKSSALAEQKAEEVDEVFAKYSEMLSNSEMEDLFEPALEMELDALEKELSFRLVQRKFNFSKTDKKDSAKISIVEDKDVSEPYGSASIYFNK